MADVSPTGTTITIPGSNLVAPGLDTFNDLVQKVNAAISGLTSQITSVGSSGGEALAKQAETVKSDLTKAIGDLQAKFYGTQTSSQPTKTETAPTINKWMVFAGVLALLWISTIFLKGKK